MGLLVLIFVAIVNGVVLHFAYWAPKRSTRRSFGMAALGAITFFFLGFIAIAMVSKVHPDEQYWIFGLPLGSLLTFLVLFGSGHASGDDVQ